MDKLFCQLLFFSGTNCEFWKSVLIKEILAILEVLDLKWRLLSGVAAFLLVVFGWFCHELVPV